MLYKKIDSSWGKEEEVVVDSLRELPQDLTPTSAAAGEKFSENGDFVDILEWIKRTLLQYPFSLFCLYPWNFDLQVCSYDSLATKHRSVR